MQSVDASACLSPSRPVPQRLPEERHRERRRRPAAMKASSGRKPWTAIVTSPWRRACEAGPSFSRNITPGSSMPECPEEVRERGRMPVAWNRPRTLPSSSMPCRSKTKMSCMVMTSPSMPTISEMEVTLRVPSEQAAHLDDHVDGAGDLLPHGLLGKVAGWPWRSWSPGGPGRPAGCWRAGWSASRRGRCSWPAACPRPRAPRTSPMMMRSGRMRRELITRSRWVTSPRPRRWRGGSPGAPRGAAAAGAPPSPRW